MNTQQISQATHLQNNFKSFSPIAMPQLMILKSQVSQLEQVKNFSTSTLPSVAAPTSVPALLPIPTAASMAESTLKTSQTVFGHSHLILSSQQHFHLAAHLHYPHLPSLGQVVELEDEVEAETKGKWWHSTASGVIGGFCCVYAGQPFDTIKVRLQTQTAANKLYSNPIDCFRKTVSQGGYRALYKGSGAALASVVLENAVLFTANSMVKDVIKSFSSNPSDNLSLGQEALAGGIAGFFSSTAITPAEVIKCRLQVQDRTTSGAVAKAPLKYKGPVDAFIKITKAEGLKGVFAGLPSVWMRDIPFNFVFLGSYEAFCSLASWQRNKSREELGMAELFLCGGLAGVSGWSIIFPMDVVKSKIQTASNSKAGSWEVIKQTFKAGGVRGFYNGWSAAVLRAFPANAALLMGVEMSKRFFQSLE